MTTTHTLLHDVVRALADVEGCAPHELQFALHDFVDTTAIERLAAMEGVEWSLSFDVPGHEVGIDSDGRVVVDGTVMFPEGKINASGSS